MMAQVASVVVVTYNGAYHLQRLLPSLARQTVQDFELLVVENGSTDGSVQLLDDARVRYGFDIKVLRNGRNMGFAPACNQGIQAAQSDNLVMLNNDTRPEPTWLEHLLACAETDSGIGMVACKMLRGQNPKQIDSAGIALDTAGIAWDWRGGDADHPDESERVEVFGPCGGAALYARRMIEQIGAFDSDFFAYLEDVDLAWRGRLAGWRCVLEPRARVLHEHSGTLGDASPQKRFLLARNKVWLLVKNYPQPWFGRYGALIWGYDGLAALYGMAKRADLASMRGRIAGWRGVRPMLQKRKMIQARWRDVNNWRRLVQPAPAPWSVPQRYAHLGNGAVPLAERQSHLPSQRA